MTRFASKACLAALLLCLTGLPVSAETPQRPDDWWSRELPDDCAPESEAYAALSDLARRFRQDGMLFAHALVDLRYQLHDCLDAADGPDDAPESPPLPAGNGI